MNKKILSKIMVIYSLFRYRLYIIRSYIDYLSLFIRTAWNNQIYFLYYDPFYNANIEIAPTYRNFMRYIRNFSKPRVGVRLLRRMSKDSENAVSEIQQ